MSPDFRYHVASLAAVFVALGIGILVGTAFVGTPIVERQTRLIRGLEGRVGDVRREIDERERVEQALLSVAPVLVGNRLNGRRVLVIDTEALPQTADQVTEALREAGADVVRVRLPLKVWRDYVGMEGEVRPPDTTPITEPIMRAIVRGDGQALQKWREQGFVDGDNWTGTISFVVMTGGAPALPKPQTPPAPDESEDAQMVRARDLLFATGFTEAGVTVVVAEPYIAAQSFVPTFRANGIRTVDCVDRPLGRVALPLVLLSQVGSYGVKNTADKPLPDITALSASNPQLEPSPAPLPSVAPAP
jgi:hypothetical protein